MKAPELPNEAQRLEALRAYKILDSEAEHSYDDITKLAAYICRVPMATISILDEGRQWFKSRIGLSVSETSRDVAFCAHAILRSEPMVVVDATRDPRFSTSPLVTKTPKIRFYAGFPLVNHEGFALGTLCAIDRRPRRISSEQTEAMGALARQVMALLEYRRVSHTLGDALERVKTLHGLLPICAWCKRIRDDKGYWLQVESYLQQRTDADFTHGICPECRSKTFPKPGAAKASGSLAHPDRK